ncbi:ABC transporter ATP-binding protein [Candidatus Dependentiae bacterium]|nr:ABC transporter ATP-binding protein [Candidatus Dependentiae bacterium]
MPNIKLENITKSYKDEVIVHNFNLTIPSGKFFALLGPSGSGKTTLLRLIAGFEKPDKGDIYLGDKRITDEPINERRVNTVFQHYALFPHLNVFDNVAYGLTVKKIPKDAIEKKVMKMLKVVGLEKHRNKSISQLSGGQQQRVALARAIVNEPQVLLLDEPLAALDLKLRERMVIELIDLQDQLGTTFVYVTHDQFEALTVADYMAIMNTDGEIEQVGTPKEIYEFPVSSFVAEFVGTTNIMKGTIEKSGDTYVLKTEKLGSLEIVTPDKKWAVKGAHVLMSLRPEKIEISKKKLDGFSNVLKGTVEAIVYYGRSTQYSVRVKNGSLVHVFEQNDEHFPKETIDYDDTVYLHWQKNNVVLLKK